MDTLPPATPLTTDASPLPIDCGSLHVGQALQLLERGGIHLPAHLAPGSAQWLQAMLDALCTLSSRDPLTGLVNRRQFEAALDREVDRVARAGETALLLLADIDHFKRINDTHGHAAGDAVIQGVGQLLAQCVRPMDTVARIGGEEFAIVLPNCAPAFGFMVAERIRHCVEDGRFAIHGSSQQLSVSISLGGAFAPQWVRSTRQLWLERADRQLYRAKQEGRNRACLESPPVSEVSAEERGLLFGSPSAFVPDDMDSPS